MAQLTKEDLLLAVKKGERGKFVRHGDFLFGDFFNDHQTLNDDLRKLTGLNLPNDAGFYQGREKSCSLDVYGSSPTLRVGEKGSVARKVTRDLIARILSGTNVEVNEL